MSELIFIPDPTAMLAFGARLGEKAKAGDIIFLRGPLGAGKTTLTRGFLKALGVSDRVKSPTFTLVECYELEAFYVFHFDLYRLKYPEELLQIGLEDYLSEDAVCLFEWPEQAETYLPKPDYCCCIEIPESGKGRLITLRTDMKGGSG